MTTRRFRVTVDGEVFEVEVEEIAGKPSVVDVEDSLPTGRAVAAPPPGPPPVPSASLPAKGPGALAPTGPESKPTPQGSPGRPRPEVTKPTAGGEPGSGTERVEAPLPGTVLSVPAVPGAEVKAGQVVVVLEAMKMQNEIVAPRDGKVMEVAVNKGDTVALGDLLVTIA